MAKIDNLQPLILSKRQWLMSKVTPSVTSNQLFKPSINDIITEKKKGKHFSHTFDYYCENLDWIGLLLDRGK